MTPPSSATSATRSGAHGISSQGTTERAPSNSDLIRPIYEEWGRGNFQPRFDVYDAHMEWGWSDEFPGLDGVFEDNRTPNPRLQTWLRDWEYWCVEVDEYLEIGDHVVALTRFLGRGRGSGVEVQHAGAHVLKLRDGKVVRLEIFSDRQKAIASVHAAELRTGGSLPQ